MNRNTNARRDQEGARGHEQTKARQANAEASNAAGWRETQEGPCRGCGAAECRSLLLGMGHEGGVCREGVHELGCDEGGEAVRCWGRRKWWWIFSPRRLLPFSPDDWMSSFGSVLCLPPPFPEENTFLCDLMWQVPVATARRRRVLIFFPGSKYC
jgi:hypothetical protein